MPLDIWLKSDDIDRNNKTSVRSEMGTAVTPSHPLNTKQFLFFQALCMWNSSSWAVPVKFVQPSAWTWVSQTGWDHFLQCLSFVQGWWQGLVELLPGLLQPSAVVPVTCKVLGVHIPLWKETSECPRGRWWQGWEGNYSNLDWGPALFPPLPSSCFSSDRKTTWKKGSLQILQILFQGDVLVRLGWESTVWKRSFFPLGALGLGRRAACARMSKRTFGTSGECSYGAGAGLLADLPNTSLW